MKIDAETKKDAWELAIDLAIEVVDIEPSIDLEQAGNINVKLYELRAAWNRRSEG